jgi:hypothetical protein
MFLAYLEGCRLGDRAENSDCLKKRPEEVIQKKNVKIWEYLRESEEEYSYTVAVCIGSEAETASQMLPRFQYRH